MSHQMPGPPLPLPTPFCVAFLPHEMTAGTAVPPAPPPPAGLALPPADEPPSLPCVGSPAAAPERPFVPPPPEANGAEEELAGGGALQPPPPPPPSAV